MTVCLTHINRILKELQDLNKTFLERNKPKTEIRLNFEKRLQTPQGR